VEGIADSETPTLFRVTRTALVDDDFPGLAELARFAGTPVPKLFKITVNAEGFEGAYITCYATITHAEADRLKIGRHTRRKLNSDDLREVFKIRYAE
jgi:hypothetical protein